MRNIKVGFFPDRVIFSLGNQLVSTLPLTAMNEEGYAHFENQDAKYFKNFFAENVKESISKKSNISILSSIEKLASEDLPADNDPASCLKTSEAHPVAIYLILSQRFGMDWLQYDIAVIEDIVKSEFGLDELPETNAGKISAILMPNQSENVYTNAYAFEKAVLSICSKPVDFMQSQIEDISYNEQFLAKRKKLFNAFADYQNKNQCANNIIQFIQNVLSPQRYVDNTDIFNKVKNEVNKQLAFEGLNIDDSNQIVSVAKASKISDVQIKVDGLKNKLIQQGAHQLVFSYCNAELLANNYFHSVLESSKGLVKRIQDIADVTYDGQNLMEKVFKDEDPILIVNNFQSKSEKDEHRGFRNLLIGIVAMFRNPASHELKVEWDMSEQDALDILAMISYCHRRLDNAQKIRLG